MGGKKVTGRKRHLLVDTLGNLLTVIVHPANISDSSGADWVLEEGITKSHRLTHLWADSNYRGDLVDYWEQEHGITIEIVTKQPDQTGFAPLPKRWIVERTIAWISRYRRLAKDYERWEENSEAMVYLASIHLLLGRLAPKSAERRPYATAA
jgi:putative transposase